MVTIIRRNPVRALTMMEPFLHPRGILDEAERVVRDFWPRWEGGVTGTIPLDMYEHKDELVIRAELPGLKREDIDLRFEGEALTIRADKKVEAPEGVTYYRSELCYGSYLQSLALPFPVDGEKFAATFENGVLEVRVPKAVEVKGKHIEIKGG